jgi:hypothetical protein
MIKREPRWYFVVYSLALGAVMAVAGVIGDQRWLAGASLPIMAVFGVAMALTPWGTLRQRSQDEREQAIGKDAALVSYYVVVICVIGAFLVEVARGQDGHPWAGIGFIAGVSFLVSLGVLARRR